MRAMVTLTVGGVAGFFLLKLFTSLLLPVLGLFFGLLALTVKLALWAALIFFLYSFLRKREEERTA